MNIGAYIIEQGGSSELRTGDQTEAGAAEPLAEILFQIPS
jgi:hypothetical protein